MSGTLSNFPALEGDSPEGYAPGAGRADERSLADAVICGIAYDRPIAETVRLYGLYDTAWSEEMIPVYARECAAHLGLRDAPQDFDPSVFLQAVIEGAAQEMIPDSQPALQSDPLLHVTVDFLEACGRFYDLLHLLVQTLYVEGYNGFTIDFTPALSKMRQAAPAFCQYPFGEMATHLIGHPENPLKLSCIGEFESFGARARDCDLALRGRATNAGWNGIGTTYDLLDCTVEHVGAGNDCAYFVDTVDPVREMWCYDNPTHNAYHVRSGVTKDDVRTLRKRNFWGHGYHLSLGTRMRNWLLHGPVKTEKHNTLLVPDASGGWKEVGP